MHIAEAKRMTGTDIPWLCDSMDDAFTKAFGGTYNGEFVIDPQGRIVKQRFWSNPHTLRADLTSLVGEVANPTKIEDLPVRFRPEPREIASGVAPKIELPSGLAPVRIKYLPISGDRPFYVKLRAELTEQRNAEDQQQLYLGFYMDPIYRVHWNNAAGPIEVEIDADTSLELSQNKLVGPKLEEAADVDPRMFLIGLNVDSKPTGPMRVKIQYVVCDDAETFCVPITQEYEVSLEPANNGSTRPGIFLDRIFGDVKKFDKNKDGKITAAELGTGNVTMYMTHIDYNLDNVIDAEELERFNKMYGNGRGVGK